MLEPDNTNTPNTTADAPAPAKAAPRKRAPRKATAPAGAAPVTEAAPAEPASEATPVARKRPARKAAKAVAASPAQDDASPASGSTAEAVAATPTRTRRPAKKAAKAAASAPADPTLPAAETAETAEAPATERPAKATRKRQPRKSAAAPAPTPEPTESDSGTAPALAAPSVLFVAPAETKPPTRQRRAAKAPAGPPPSTEPAPATADITVAEDVEDATAEPEDVREAAVEEATGARRRRRRGRRGRGGAARPDGDDGTDDETGDAGEASAENADTNAAADIDEAGDDAPGTRRRRKRRRSAGSGSGDGGEDDPPNTVTHVRQTREKSADDDGVKGVKGSTRLEAKRQRRRDGRDTNRRRPPILTESEFLARREAVDRVMAVRQHGDRTQIAVLEDDVLVEHYVTRESATSYVGNVYLGRVQNVLPSMEAAFVDIGKGRNGVIYAGEVNWDAAGLEGKSRAIENALKSGDVVLVQVTKDPIGHKGARLTSQVSLPGRFLVYVPGGGMTGISRKLPDVERHRLKAILKKIVPEDAGVIIRTAAEGATEEELTRDVDRLKAQWESIQKKAAKTGSAPTLVHGEPDLAIRVVRDVFNEDFKSLVVQGESAWQTVSEYVEGVAPDLAERVSRYTGDADLFHDLRVDEQLMKALDRKVYLPSGGSLVIDRTEAMTVIDVNTGKFVGSGGNLEQTVTRNNIEAAEEIVRQLRLRDVGGIVVIDFIDMVLESNRELVLRRLTECLGRDRTKHQVAEVTSLGLVQMTRKRVGEGLLEAFSENCTVCNGRGVIVHGEPVDKGPSGSSTDDEDSQPKSRRKRGGSKKAAEPIEVEPPLNEEQRRAALTAMSAIHRAAHPEDAALSDAELVEAHGTEAVAELLDPPTDDTTSTDGPAEKAEPDSTDGAQLELPTPDQPESTDEPESADEPESTDEAEPDPAPEASTPVAVPPLVTPAVEDDDADRWAEPVAAAGPAKPRRRRTASRPAGPPAVDAAVGD